MSDITEITWQATRLLDRLESIVNTLRPRFVVFQRADGTEVAVNPARVISAVMWNGVVHLDISDHPETAMLKVMGTFGEALAKLQGDA